MKVAFPNQNFDELLFTGRPEGISLWMSVAITDFAGPELWEYVEDTIYELDLHLYTLIF